MNFGFQRINEIINYRTHNFNERFDRREFLSIPLEKV